MSFAPSYNDNQPITWWKRIPIYATSILTALFAFGVVICAVLGIGAFPAPFAFIPETFVAGAFWQPLTYAFVDGLSFFTPFGLLCFYAWAVEIEKYLGRRKFFTLFGVLILAQPIICLVWWKTGIPVPPWGSAVKFGNYEIMAAMLIGFATLYPNVEYLFGWVPLKWFAFTCFVAGSLMHIAQRNWFLLSLLWAECAIAFGFIRWVQLGGAVELPKLSSLLRRKPKLHVLPPPVARRREEQEAGEVESIDPLLDKIARTGMASLTARERARLEKAREALLKKDRR